MEKIFNPSHRKWISPPVPVGQCVEEIKKLVRLHKENLLIIDPTPKLMASEKENISTFLPDYLNSDAVTVSGTEPLVEGESDPQDEIQVRKEDRWSESDASCEAAVAAVGGNDFFVFGGKKKKDGKRKRGRKAKMDTEDNDDEDLDDDYEEDEEYDDEEDIDEYAEETEENKDEENDSNIYENYDYDGDSTVKTDVKMKDYDDILQSMLTAEEEELRHIAKMLPDALSESDDENDWLDYDDDTDNVAGFAQRLDEMKHIIDDDSDDSDQEDLKKFDLSDEEETPNCTGAGNVTEEGVVNDGEIPCCSKNIPTATPFALPKRSSLSSGKQKERKQKKVTINLVEDVKEEIENVPISSQASGSAQPEDTSEQKKEVYPDVAADFKRFSEWVFHQNNKRDKASRHAARSTLIENLKLSEEDIQKLQSETSANLSSVKGEVFQDEQVMQSSSMPLLAPPTNLAARTSLQSLAIFLTHGEDPSVFPWKSINVQQQMNDDFVYHQFLKRMEQQKKDIMNPAMKDKLVNKEDDFLLQVLIYQATDPDDVLPDEVKLRRKLTDEVEVIAAWSHDKRRGGRQPGSGYSNCEDDGFIGALSGPNRYIEPRLAYEVHLLGSQTVRDLMNAFHCENDYVCLKEISHPDKYKNDPADFAKAHFPNSMILINGVIYTDPDCKVDYMSIINDWASKPPAKNIGPFTRGDWNTLLKDLTLSFGFPYVYIHLGGCEHIYVFTKSRLLHAEDDHILSSYPKIVGQTRFKNVYCRVDNEYLARWAVLDFKEFPENPMLLCTECVLMYCYDKQKNKRGNFKLYPFTQMANIL